MRGGCGGEYWDWECGFGRGVGGGGDMRERREGDEKKEILFSGNEKVGDGLGDGEVLFEGSDTIFVTQDSKQESEEDRVENTLLHA